MRDLVIYGAGGFGRETALMIYQINRQTPLWNLLGFYDDGKEKGLTIDGLPVLGSISDLNRHGKEMDVVLGISDPVIRRKLRSEISNTSLSFPAVIHPSVMTGDLQRNSMGDGVIIAAGNFLTTNVHVKAFVIINFACTIGHDVTIGEFSSVMPGCSISGSVTLESEVMVGTGARILPGLTIGARSRVGAGAVVTKNVAAGLTVVGVPAKAISSR